MLKINSEGRIEYLKNGVESKYLNQTNIYIYIYIQHTPGFFFAV